MQNELCIVADAIKALREARGLTQEQLAEKQIFPYPIWQKSKHMPGPWA